MKLLIVLVALFAASSAAPAGTILDLLASNGFKAALDAFTKNGLADVLKGAGPLTVFVPTDDAFKAFATQKPDLFKAVSDNPAMFKKLLADHIVTSLIARKDITNNQVITTLTNETARFNVYGTGDKQVITINGVVLKPEIVASNGIIYPIDRVIISDKHMNIPDLLKNDTRFSFLYKALEAVGLLAALDAASPFTVFAPTDAAFKTVPQPVLTKLMASPADLKKIFLGHVLPGAIYRNGAVTGDAVTSAGTPVAIVVTGSDANGNMTVAGANVTEFDIPANNGVIHAIDKVIGV